MFFEHGWRRGSKRKKNQTSTTKTTQRNWALKRAWELAFVIKCYVVLCRGTDEMKKKRVYMLHTNHFHRNIIQLLSFYLLFGALCCCFDSFSIFLFCEWKTSRTACCVCVCGVLCFAVVFLFGSMYVSTGKNSIDEGKSYFCLLFTEWISMWIERTRMPTDEIIARYYDIKRKVGSMIEHNRTLTLRQIVKMKQKINENSKQLKRNWFRYILNIFIFIKD